MMSAIRRLALRSGIRCATKSHRRVAGPHSQRATKTGRNWPDMSPSVYRRRTSWSVLDSPETGFEDLTFGLDGLLAQASPTRTLDPSPHRVVRFLLTCQIRRIGGSKTTYRFPTVERQLSPSRRR